MQFLTNLENLNCVRELLELFGGDSKACRAAEALTPSDHRKDEDPHKLRGGTLYAFRFDGRN